MENRFKRALREGRPLVGFWASLGSPLSAELLAYGGADWVLVDLEHGPAGVPELLARLQAMAGAPASALTRVPSDDPTTIKKVLDVGAQTLLVPFVETAEQAAAVVASARYAPEGRRGMALATRAADFGRDRDYLATANREVCLMVQIETARGVENVDPIAAVDGVDALLVGPADLSASLGHVGNASHPAVEQAIAAILEAARRAQKPVGIYSSSAADARARIAQGFRVVALGSDVQLLAAGTQRAVTSVLG
jgi:4-hydroxy-2-oxoheptanedioate aldolase